MSQPIVVQDDLVQFASPIGNAVLAPLPVTVPIASNSWRPTIQGKPMCIVADALRAQRLAVGYTADAFSVPGTGNLTVTAVNADQQRPWLTINRQLVLLKGSQFTALFTLASPATQQPPSSIPDPQLQRSGVGELVTAQSLVRVS